MLYRVRIVYERTKEGFGSRNAVYEEIGVAAPNEELAKQRAVSVGIWRGLAPVATVHAETCKNFIHIRNGQVAP